MSDEDASNYNMYGIIAMIVLQLATIVIACIKNLDSFTCCKGKNRTGVNVQMKTTKLINNVDEIEELNSDDSFELEGMEEGRFWTLQRHKGIFSYGGNTPDHVKEVARTLVA